MRQRNQRCIRSYINARAIASLSNTESNPVVGDALALLESIGTLL